VLERRTGHVYLRALELKGKKWDRIIAEAYGFWKYGVSISRKGQERDFVKE